MASWTVEIDAPRQAVFDVAADVPASVVWQPALQTVEVLETDERVRFELADLPLAEKAQPDHDEKIEHDRADKSSSHSHPPFLGVCPAEGRNNRFHPEKSGLKYIKKTQK